MCSALHLLILTYNEQKNCQSFYISNVKHSACTKKKKIHAKISKNGKTLFRDHTRSVDVLFWFYYMIYSLGENLQTNLFVFRVTLFLMKGSILISDSSTIWLYIKYLIIIY